MVFSSEVFLFLFLPVTYLLYLAIPKLRARNILLIIVSLVFYAYGEPAAVLLMILSVICNYFFGRAMANERCKKPVLIVSVVFNVGMLFVFKYLTYTLSLVKTVFHAGFSVPDIALPIGISFFTFQAMSYVIDAYKKPALIRRNILDIFLYISFFPQLIAGPIIRFEDIARQIDSRSVTAQNTVDGIQRFICGLAKKVLIANVAGFAADTVFGFDLTQLSIGAAWIGAVCYTVQIYFDFSGYSDMAIGLGKMFGFTFKENFNYPLAAGCMTDFWRKWNISVSTSAHGHLARRQPHLCDVGRAARSAAVGGELHGFAGAACQKPVPHGAGTCLYAVFCDPGVCAVSRGHHRRRTGVYQPDVLRLPL